MAWGQPAWGADPAPLDPLLAQIRAGKVRDLTLFSSQRVRTEDWARLFDALAEADRAGHGVRSLHISGHRIPTEAHAALHTYLSEAATALTALAILARDATDADLAPWANGLAAAKVVNLEELDVSGKALAGPCANLGRFVNAAAQSLRKLDVAANAGTLSLPAGTTLPTLATLVLADCDLDAPALRGWLAATPNVADLDVAGNTRIAADVPAWAPLAANLTAVAVAGTHFDDAALTALLHACPSLQTVNAAECRVTGTELANDLRAPKCTTLVLRKNPVAALDRILTAVPNVEVLDVAECKGLDASHLNAVLQMPRIQTVGFRGNTVEADPTAGGKSAAVTLDLTATNLSLPVLRSWIARHPSVVNWEVASNPCSEENDGAAMLELAKEILPRNLYWR
ncbi:hypothetical protein GGF31_007904 [Allomyces arbusculus]|nr:hypothetical protein GGF31_007904 [Allomyces arbusculus]